jgi:hypothetical protein
MLAGSRKNPARRRNAMKASLLLASMLIVAMPATAAVAATVKLTATLTGANEVPPADPDGTGTFNVEIDPDKGDFCYTITSAKIAAPVVTLDPKGSDECIAVEPDALKPIIATPEAYYVNIHNAEFPGGAIRGQLMLKK